MFCKSIKHDFLLRSQTLTPLHMIYFAEPEQQHWDVPQQDRLSGKGESIF